MAASWCGGVTAMRTRGERKAKWAMGAWAAGPHVGAKELPRWNCAAASPWPG